jgi:hypothetical protein
MGIDIENDGSLLEIAGKALFGAHWQGPLAKVLGLSDTKRIRQWLVGGRPVPDGVWNDIHDMLRERGILINAAIVKIDHKLKKTGLSE